MAKLDVSAEFLAEVLFPGLRVRIVGCAAVAHGWSEEAEIASLRLELEGEDAPKAKRATAIVHAREFAEAPGEVWRRVEVVSADTVPVDGGTEITDERPRAA